MMIDGAAPFKRSARYAGLVPAFGGAEGSRTPDLYNAIVALSQLSYGPGKKA